MNLSFSINLSRMNPIQKYFPEISHSKLHQFKELLALYEEWNQKINVVSRKDMDNLMIRHVLHSLSIARFFGFREGTKVMDVGTGGGFPGIPLAIYFPDVHFHLIDSIAKKIKVVASISEALGLSNVSCEQVRAEKLEGKVDFIVSRAVTKFPLFVRWTKKHIDTKRQMNDMTNGIIYLKGGDIETEILPFKNEIKVFDLSAVFEEAFFKTKKLLYLPFSQRA